LQRAKKWSPSPKLWKTKGAFFFGLHYPYPSRKDPKGAAKESPLMISDELKPDAIRGGLGKSLFATDVIYRETLDSTNRLAKELASAGAPEGTIIITEEQTAGRGRRGRSWLSPGRANLTFSLLLRPALVVDRIFTLTMILALACVEAVQEKTGLSCMIKWPNDLYAGGRKLSGILTEFATKDRQLEWVVLGLGLNVNWYPAEGESMSRLATSIQAETGKTVSRNELLVEILMQFEEYYNDVRSGKIGELYERWNDFSLVLGKHVLIESDQTKITGKALRIDQDGALIIEDGEGKEQKIIHGDVSLRFEEGTPLYRDPEVNLTRTS
jgi:BirA family biotin operon repressor/biotin-[acetyl-CoA-carboxylase] ligase